MARYTRMMHCKPCLNLHVQYTQCRRTVHKHPTCRVFDFFERSCSIY